MDPRLLRYYNRELQYIHEMGGEFAREFPKIAGRLGLEAFECSDPYVERLLEGFAFLAARVQLKIDSEFPRFTQHLLEMVYPHYLAPTPSMAVVQLHPNLNEGTLGDGFRVPRGTALRSLLGRGEQTACEYRTAHDVTLWPLEITQASYTTTIGDLGDVRVGTRRPRAAIRLRLKTTAGLTFKQLSLDRLTVFLRGGDELAMRLYEQIMARSMAIIARPPGARRAWQEVITGTPVQPVGFEDDQALLPFDARSFQGYRLLHEYFSFPQRFMSAQLTGLAPAVRRTSETELELIVALDTPEPALEGVVDASHFLLFCTPVINLFPRRADRIHLADSATEYQVVPDRTRPMDFEVYSVREVTGFGTSAEVKQEFLPFYAISDQRGRQERRAYYTIQREPRMLSARQRAHGARSSYVGSEVFLSLVDPSESPFESQLKQLSVETLCTNRDLPLHMTLGQARTDFTVESGAPVESVRVVAGPTPPRSSHAHSEMAWRLVGHLALNYMTLVDGPEEQGAAALRELLGLYGDVSDAAVRKQIEGVRSVSARPVTRRLPIPGPLSFARGLEITLTCDETAFEGSGVYLLGAVLERFLAKASTINSFTESVLRTTQRGEVMRWQPRTGRRPLL